jgi:hypothetical protein
MPSMNCVVIPSFDNAFAVFAGPPPTTALRSVPSGIKSITTSPHTQTLLFTLSLLFGEIFDLNQ